MKVKMNSGFLPSGKINEDENIFGRKVNSLKRVYKTRPMRSSVNWLKWATIDKKTHLLARRLKKELFLL